MARACYLTVAQRYDLDIATGPVQAAFGHVYLVGSVLTRATYRDVDVRCILEDETYDAMFAKRSRRVTLLGVAMSEWLEARTGLPIDFQFQRMTQANAEFDGARIPLGLVLPMTIAETEE